MTDIFKQLISMETDCQAAFALAQEVAKLLGSKAVSNPQIVLGEECCPFKIPVHTGKFHCFVYVSDSSYRFSAKCRSRRVSDFFVSLKQPAPSNFAKIRSPAASKALGIEVFRQPFLTDKEIQSRFLSKRMRAILKKVDFEPVSEFHLCPDELGVASALKTPAACVQQVQVFRDIATTAYNEACTRNRQDG